MLGVPQNGLTNKMAEDNGDESLYPIAILM